MKSKTLALVTLLLATVFLLTQAIAPRTALAASTWTDSHGPGTGNVYPLAYDSGHNLLYAGTYDQGVWKYNGTSWTSTAGGVSGYRIMSLAYDSVHNLLYAGCYVRHKYKQRGLEVQRHQLDRHRWRSRKLLRPLSRLRLNTQPALRRDVRLRGLEVQRNHLDPTDGGVSSYVINSLAYDSGHNLLYAGTIPAMESGSTTARAGPTLQSCRPITSSPLPTTRATTCSTRGRSATGYGSTTARAGPTPPEGSRATGSTPSPTTRATTCSMPGRGAPGSGGTTAPADRHRWRVLWLPDRIPRLRLGP